MKERIENFLLTADSPDTRDLNELKELYKAIGNKIPKCRTEVCISKMLMAVQKYYTINFNPPPPAPKKYNLKPGLHSFAPGGPAVHHNENTTDEEIEFYLSKYPFIKHLLIS